MDFLGLITTLSAPKNNFKFCLCAILSGHKKIIRTIQNVFFPSLIFRLRRKVVFKFCKFFKVKFISAGDSVKKNELINYNLKTSRIYNFYDDNKFYFINNNLKQKHRAKYKVPKNTLVLLSVGNCSNIKNHNLIFKSLSILPKNLNWIYFHIGEEDYNKSERKLAKQLDIQKKCKFLGAYYDWKSFGFISDIFLMPSLHEGLPCSAIEAGAIGLIPILSKRPGNVDILNKQPHLVTFDISSHPFLLFLTTVKGRKYCLFIENKGNLNLKTYLILFQLIA